MEKYKKGAYFSPVSACHYPEINLTFFIRIDKILSINRICKAVQEILTAALSSCISPLIGVDVSTGNRKLPQATGDTG
jgi:hypothetical protein